MSVHLVLDFKQWEMLEPRDCFVDQVGLKIALILLPLPPEC